MNSLLPNIRYCLFYFISVTNAKDRSCWVSRSWVIEPIGVIQLTAGTKDQPLVNGVEVD